MEKEEPPEGKTSVLTQTGYFDHVASVFRAHQHPIILVEEYAMRWMGLAVFSSENIDFLIKDDQLDHIIADLLATGQYERIQQDLGCRLRDPFVKQVPRLRHTDSDQTNTLCISFWPESLYMLTVVGSMVEVPDLFAWNQNLVEDRFDPAAADVMSVSYKSKLAAGRQLVPKTLAQSAESSYPVYVPSIPRLVDALLDQVRYRQTHIETYNYTSMPNMLPSYHLSNLIRYLHLERTYQREKLIPELAERNRAEMERRMNKFKRKPVLSLKDFASSSLR
ncbi:hypothetical protein GP486_001243 [Trichoglossum hirsutum]|uniref:Uncharacterized protein n=1 Tax=Trichoglossum hirsutum TaxID=265104 RepID=A0A9P8LGD1_9PEZI|nr:hypothetical protein GP486_001243 [Trichoglossum hirsutum]